MSKDLDVEQAALPLPPPVNETKMETTTVIVPVEPNATVIAVTNEDKIDEKQKPSNPPAQAANVTVTTTIPVAPPEQVQPATKTTTTTTTTAATTAPPATTETAAHKGSNKSNMDPALINFKVLYVLTQLCGLTMIVLVGTWIGQHFGGLGGSDNPKLEFNWHPLCMTIGFIYLYGNSILIYRGFRTTRKKTLKLTHAGIHLAAFVLTVIALKTVFDSHNLNSPPIPNLYSLHSWLGLAAVIIFCLQYVAGFVAFLAPGLRENYKIALMPLHIYFGLFGFGLAIASALMGITEKMIFAVPNYSALPAAGILANIIGVLYVIFGALVFYLATEPSYKRKALPEDTHLLASGNNTGNE